MFENLNLGTETLVLLGLGAGGFMFGPKKGGMASFAKLASIGLLGLGVGNATGVFTVSKLKGMLGMNGTAAGAFQTSYYYNPYQQQQYYDPFQQYVTQQGYNYQQQQQQPYSYSSYYPQYYPTGQQQQYYYPQQQYQSYPYQYQYPTYQYQQQTYYSPLTNCIQQCTQAYQY